MKRFLMMILTAATVIFLAACGGSGETTEKNIKETAVTPLQMYRAGNSLMHDGLYTGEWEKLYLSEDDAEKYPALAEVLDEMNLEQDVYHNDWAQGAEADARLAREEMEEYFYPFSANSFYYVQRADDRMVSIREDFSEYYGGVHDMYGTIGHTFDTRTGKRLELSDVLTDTTGISAILAGKLEEKYPEDIQDFNDSVTETLAEYKMEDFRWTVDYQGITFYFDPYELASFAAGRLTVTIWFDESPELFHEKYTEQPAKGYIREIPMGDQVEVDLDRLDDRRDMICVIGAPIGEYGEQRINIRRNAEGYSDPDSYGYRFTPHLVYQNDGFYLMAEGSAENEYRTIYVYDLNGEEICVSDMISGTGFHSAESEMEDAPYGLRQVWNDPAELCLDTRIHMLGTMDGVNTYEFTDGMILADSPYYELPEDFPPLVSQMPLMVYIPEDDSTEELPVGTEFYFLRTDNETYVFMELEDGRECRLEVGFDGWDRTVNGISESEVFGELLYAG